MGKNYFQAIPIKDSYENCPSCGNEYELLSDDWVLVKLRKV